MIYIEEDIEFSKNVRVENLWFEITKEKSKYLIGTIYRHPEGSVNKFTKKLKSILTKITSDSIRQKIALSHKISILI